MGKCDRTIGYEIRVVNYGKLSKAYSFKFLSHEDLMTSFRGKSEFSLHLPVFRFLQLKILSMPRCRIWGWYVMKPLDYYVAFIRHTLNIRLWKGWKWENRKKYIPCKHYSKASWFVVLSKYTLRQKIAIEI